MRPLTGSISFIAILFASATAAAQPIPGFGTMDRFDDQSKFATSLTYVGFDVDDVTGLRFDLFGQYLMPTGFGGYAMIPIDYVDFADESETGVGNLEIGGLYVLQGNVPVVLRGGLAIKTADGEKGNANLVGLVARFNDFPTVTSEVGWLRLSATPMMRRGNAFFKADVGLDIPVAEEDGVDADTLVRVNVGGGIETGGLALIGELVSVTNTNSDLDNQTVTLLGATARWMGAGPLQPSITFQLPVDEELENIIDWNIIVGLEYVLGAQNAAAPVSDAPPPPPGAY